MRDTQREVETQRETTLPCGECDVRLNPSIQDHINKRKNKNHMILSINPEKAFDKIQHPFLINTAFIPDQNSSEFRDRGSIP